MKTACVLGGEPGSFFGERGFPQGFRELGRIVLVGRFGPALGLLGGGQTLAFLVFY